MEPRQADWIQPIDAHTSPVLLFPSQPSSSLDGSTKLSSMSRSSHVSESDSSQRKRSYYLIGQEEDGAVKPYNPAKEPLPKKEVNHPSFNEAEKAAKSIPAEIIAIIDQQECSNEDVDYIRDLAKGALTPKYPEGVKIGLRGDSGTGKSSIINSLLGKADIAPQGDDGGACTSVVHEFHKPRRDQPHACEAEIFFLTPAARVAILKEWLRDFYIFQHSDAEAGDDVFEKLEEASTTAIDGIFSLLCHRDECASREAVEKFLTTAQSQEDAGMISKLKDLPGTSDVNQTRVRASLQFLNNVDYIGVVSKVERVETDANTHRYLIDAFRRKRGANVLLVATGSESVNTKPHYLNKRISMAAPVDAANLTTLKGQLEMTALDLQKIQKELRIANRDRDRDAVESLAEEERVLEFQELSLGAKLSEYCVHMRNTKVSHTVGKKYFDLTKDPLPLPIFCVSNTEYAVHTNGYKRKDMPKMSVGATGIPALRAFLHGLPATRNFHAFQHHRKLVLPSLLNNLEMTCSQTKLMRRDELQEIILSALHPASEEIRRTFEAFWSTAIVPGIAKIKTNRAAYADHAKNQLSRWTQWANATHRAFCSHHGNWRTKKVGAHDWNGIMLEPLVKDVEKDIRGWDEASIALTVELSDKLNVLLTDLISRLEDAAGPSKGAMKVFFEEMRVQNQGLDLMCQSSVERLERDLSAVKERLTNTGDPECYFVNILKRTYEDCSDITGPNARQRRDIQLKDKLTQRVQGPFMALFNTAKAAASDVVKYHANRMDKEVNNIFAGFHRIFMRNFKTDEEDTPEAKALREKLRSRVASWRKVLTDDVDRHLLICSDYAESG
ncbi:hypothetical protein SLS55_010286 [Diplodia seriata]|uniref:DUF7605 domain-containing protein n=1 Tax=Diplodia seriata TaxID=420778 RepID=A0ABR3BY36_9PEZI